MKNKFNKVIDKMIENRSITNFTNTFWIIIENIKNNLIILIIIVVVMTIMIKCTGPDSFQSMMIIGITSGVIASIAVQSATDLRDLRRDTFRLGVLIKELYYDNYGSPKFHPADKRDNKKDIIKHINDKYITISEINNILANKYGFEIFKCDIDKTVICFVTKMEGMLGPYIDNEDGAVYAYAIFSWLMGDAYQSFSFIPYINCIENIIVACMYTHTPILREHVIIKKSKLSKKDFDKTIKYMKYMSDNVICNKYEANKEVINCENIYAKLKDIWFKE